MEFKDGAFLTTFVLLICVGLFLQVFAAQSIFYAKVKESITLEDGRTAQVEVEYPNTTMQIFQNISLYWSAVLVVALIVVALIVSGHLG